MPPDPTPGSWAIAELTRLLAALAPEPRHWWQRRSRQVPDPDRAVDVVATLASWSTQQLITADAVARWPRWRHASEPLPPLVARGDLGACLLASMAPDGRLRAAAVAVLRRHSAAPVAHRMLALRAGDWVGPIRTAARTALARVTPETAPAAGPVLVALRDRAHGADALAQYAAATQAALGRPLAALLVAAPDRTAHRWAWSELIAAGMPPEDLIRLIEDAEDQWVASRAIAAVVASGSKPALHAMLGSRRAQARAAALLALDAAVPHPRVEELMWDRNRRVRRAAQWVGQREGIDVAADYLARWDAERDPLALIAAGEVGVPLAVSDVLTLLRDDAVGVQQAGVRLLGRGPWDAEAWAALTGALSRPALVGEASRALARSPHWSYDDLAPLWPAASEAVRPRLWALLRGRGGWDRVRADVLATIPAEDGTPLPREALADLTAWQQEPGAAMYRRPSASQRADLTTLLAGAALPPGLAHTIAERARL